MKRIIGIILFGRKKSHFAECSLSIIGLYLGFLFWYYIVNIWKQPTSNGLVLAVSILGIGSVLLSLYLIPDQLCTNPQIGQLLYFPVEVTSIIYIVIGRLFKIQLLLCSCFLLPDIHFSGWNMIPLILTVILCGLYLIILNLSIFLIAIAVSVISKKVCGYFILALQYGGFLFIASAGVHLFTIYITTPLLLNKIYRYFSDTYILHCFIIIGILLLLLAFSIRISETYYLKSYYNLNSFTKPTFQVHITKNFTKNPYILNEWCRVVRNKELLFYSGLKSMITVYLLFNIFLKGMLENSIVLQNIPDIFLMVSCSAVNTISSTSYSGDKNIPYYNFLPIERRKLFFSKVLISSMCNEVVILCIWILSNLNRNGVSLNMLLLLYGTFTNILCSYIGVYFDYKMPRTVNSPNALFHGNMSKLFVLLTMSALTLLEIYFLEKLGFLNILLGMFVINVLFLILLAVIAARKGDAVYDRDK